MGVYKEHFKTCSFFSVYVHHLLKAQIKQKYIKSTGVLLGSSIYEVFDMFESSVIMEVKDGQTKPHYFLDVNQSHWKTLYSLYFFYRYILCFMPMDAVLYTLWYSLQLCLSRTCWYCFGQLYGYHAAFLHSIFCTRFTWFVDDESHE